MTENESYCNCNVECEETSFDLSLSISSWPSDQYLVEILKHSFRIFLLALNDFYLYHWNGVNMDANVVS